MSSSSGREAMYANARCQRSAFDLEVELLDLVGVDADGVAARAEAAVDRAGVERQEERLVDVAVREPRRPARRRARAASRARAWDGRARGATPSGMNCDAQRIVVRVRPVDQRQQVRRHAHAHRRCAKPRVASSMNSGDASAPSAASSFCDVGDRVLRLPLVIEELRLGHVRVGGDLLPERRRAGPACGRATLRRRAP